MIGRAPLLVLVAAVACGDDGTGTIDPAGPWSRGPALPSVRLEPGVTALPDAIVVAGGFGPGLAIQRTVLAFDPSAGTWREGPQLPVEWTHLQVAAIDRTLYVLGGLAGTQFLAKGDTFALPPGATAWSPRAPLPAGAERGSAAVVVQGTNIYLLGGASTDAALASCWVYDSALDAWAPLPALPAPRSHPAALITADGTIVVAGGLATLDATRPIADVIALAPGAAAWTARAPLPVARGGCAYATVGGRLLCAGGEAGTAALQDAYLYDPAADTWTAVAPLPEPRAGTQAAALGDAVYLPGGAYALRYEPRDTMLVYR